jgi:hypothetical protein
MSVEALILLAFFVVVPLLQRLLAQARERNRPTPQPAHRGPLPTPPPAARVPRVPTPPIPPLPALEADRFDMHPAARARDAVTPATAASSGPRRGRRGAVSAMPHTRLDLRRAITAAAILGPCRAIDPHY